MKILRTILLGILVVAGLAYLNVIIPQPQKTDASVTAYYNSDICGNLKVQNTGSDITESPSCTSGGKATTHTNDYQTSVTVYNSSDHSITGDFGWDEYWCNYDSGNSCGGAGNPKETTFNRTGGQATIPAHSSKTFTSSKNHPVGQGVSFCGVYQHDFTFHYSDGNKSCGPGNPSTGKAFYTMDWGVCRAGTGTDANCHPTHKACQNNACVSVDGAGTDTCTGNADCQPQQHLACKDYACVMVPGPGAPQCTTNPNSCAQQHHNVCQNQTCVRVVGPGQDSCKLDSTDCQNPPHLIVKKHVINDDGGTKNAQDFIIFVKDANTDKIISETAGNENGTNITLPKGILYSVYEGDHNGYDQTFSGDCSGMVAAGDTKTCTLINNDIKNATHMACVDNACKKIDGAGSDSCNTDNDCKTATHKACVSQACTLVMGSGSDSCSQDSDCHVDTCSGTNCGNINITVEQHQQQQQQQAVLGASVAPATNASSLPSTGSGAEVLFGLLGLLPIGFKLRKLV